jgi:hypothetical protein
MPEDTRMTRRGLRPPSARQCRPHCRRPESEIAGLTQAAIKAIRTLLTPSCESIPPSTWALSSRSYGSATERATSSLTRRGNTLDVSHGTAGSSQAWLTTKPGPLSLLSAPAPAFRAPEPGTLDRFRPAAVPLTDH